MYLGPHMTQNYYRVMFSCVERTYKATHADVFLMMAVNDQNDSWNLSHLFVIITASQVHLSPLLDEFLLSYSTKKGVKFKIQPHLSHGNA